MLPANLSKKSALLLTALALSACGSASGKKNGATSSSSSSTGAASSSVGVSAAGASVTSIYPANGYVGPVPTSVTVNFSSANLHAASISAVTSYTLTCGGNNPVAASSVTYLTGMASVTAIFPNISAANGSACTFEFSAAARDGAGNPIAGNRIATYSVQVTAPTGGSGTWVAAATATRTAAVGNTGGVAFSGIGANDMILQGLLLNGTQSVDGVVGVWAHRFLANYLSYGQAHGASAGGYTQMSCPVGFRITGIYGKAGVHVDSIGIICHNEDYSQIYHSSTMGGAGGNDYELSCPAGRFATELHGRAGAYVEQLSLGCR